MQETGSLVLRLLMRPLTNGAKRSVVAEWGAEAPDWLSTAESHYGWCWCFTLLFFSHIRELYDNHQVISIAHCVKKMFKNLVIKGTVGKLLTCRLQICNKNFLPPKLVHCILIYIRSPDNSQQAGCMSCYTLSVLLHPACFYYTLPVSVIHCLCR